MNDKRWTWAVPLALLIMASGCKGGGSGGSGGGGAGAGPGGGGQGGSGGTVGHGGSGGAAGQGGSGGTAGHGGSGGSGPCTGDCSDPSCAALGYQCAASAAGWTGPVILSDSAPGAAPQDCPAAFPSKVYQGVRGSGAAAACTPCACGAIDVTCTPGPILQFGNSVTACPMFASVSTPQGPADTCNPANFGDPLGGTVYLIQPPTAAATCAPPSGGQIMPVDPPWDAVGFACAAEAADPGCSGDAVCVPPPPSPFLARACVYQAGDHACPAGYPDKHLFFGVSDTRACAACACSPDAPASCSAQTSFYTDAACGTVPFATAANTGDCAAVAGKHATSLKVTTTITGPSACAAAGGEPSGKVAQDQNPTTFCCLSP